MTKKTKKSSLFKEVMINSLWVFGYSMVISFLSTLFLFAQIDEFLRFVLGLILLLPLCVLIYTRGNIMATKEFVKRNPSITPDKSRFVNRVPLYYTIITVLPFISMVFLFVLLGSFIPGLFPLQSIALYITLPVTMCFKAVGLIPSMEIANPYAVLCVAVFFIIIFTVYFYAYVKVLKDKEISFQQMINEMNYNRKI